MDKMKDDERNNYCKEDSIDDQNCDTCGLEKFQIENEKTGGTLIEIKKSICLIKSQIDHLREQILGFKQYDENAKPKIALSTNEFLVSKTFEELQKKHKCLLKVFFDTETYKSRSLPNLIPMDRVKFVYIETPEELNIMLDELLKFKEIGVNLECYSQRSYYGFTWLLQISTEGTYYMINCLKLQKELYVLNTIFMDIKILKIFHNGEKTVLRLYKNFGILVTNMFDTGILQKILMESKKKELLQKNISFEASQRHTHFLIFLKTYLINFSTKVCKERFLKSMRQNCKGICKRVYSKCHRNKLSITKLLPNIATKEERYVATELLKWRDEIAQKEDESPNFILPDNNIFKIAQELLDNRSSSTINKCYGCKFWCNEETYFNIHRVVSIAQNMPNDLTTYQRFLMSINGPNKNYIGVKLNTKNSKDHGDILEKQAKDKVKTNQPVEKIIKIISTSRNKIVSRVKVLIEESLLKIFKPQICFKDVVDNDSSIWKPSITTKPNAMEPLDLHLEHQGLRSRYCHPYKAELDNFVVPHSQLDKQIPIEFKKLEETPLHIVRTSEHLQSMLNDLKKYRELAVDLKYNEKRSYLGYTCFIIISTRNSDYVIDALLLRSELHILNEIFTDPTVLKVFHDSVRQMMWLQKDFSVYVINMFDTARTTVANGKKILSLSNLKHEICKVSFKKIYETQLSAVEKDWRVRPFSTRVKNYLRLSTHYLLYIKDILSNKLFMYSNCLKRFYDYCTDLCKKGYCKPFYQTKSYKNILERKAVKNRYAGHTARIRVMKELYNLRHNIAQKEDENPEFVMPNYVLLKLVDTLPNNEQKIADLWKYDKERIYVSQVKEIICYARNLKVSLKNDNDDHYIHEELEYPIQEKHTNQEPAPNDKNYENYERQDFHLTLADFLCNNKAVKNGSIHLQRNYGESQAKPQAKKKESHCKKKEPEDTSFIVIKGKYWNNNQTIKDWLKYWISVKWSGKFEMKEIQESKKMKIILTSKKFKNIIWNKRFMIHSHEGTLITKDLTAKQQMIQKNLLNISKDLRTSGLKVKVRDHGIKIEDKWYEWKTEGGLQEISEEEAREKGIDVDL